MPELVTNDVKPNSNTETVTPQNNETPIVTPVDNKVEMQKMISEMLKKELEDFKTSLSLQNNVTKTDTIKPDTIKPVVDDFESKMAEYERKKFYSSLSNDDKTKISAIPNSKDMSIDTIQYILGLIKPQTKSFPNVTGGASQTVEPQSQDDFIKSYKEYEKSLKKGGK